MKKLYFARHGESEANQKKLFAGTWDTPLTELGRSQAKNEGEQAQQLKIDLIVSSTLVRAHETAEIIAQEIDYPKDKILTSELMRERNYGELQQKPYSAADGADFEEVAGIETSQQLLERGVVAVNFLQSLPADNILVVGHGTFGRVLRDQILKQRNAIEVPIEDELPNAQIIEWI